jgi:hypothetical protein
MYTRYLRDFFSAIWTLVVMMVDDELDDLQGLRQFPRPCQHYTYLPR